MGGVYSACALDLVRRPLQDQGRGAGGVSVCVPSVWLVGGEGGKDGARQESMASFPRRRGRTWDGHRWTNPKCARLGERGPERGGGGEPLTHLNLEGGLADRRGSRDE